MRDNSTDYEVVVFVGADVVELSGLDVAEGDLTDFNISLLEVFQSISCFQHELALSILWSSPLSSSSEKSMVGSDYYWRSVL